MFLIYILIAVIIYIGFYFLGTLICKKVKFLKENANNTSVIILSLILIPLVMIKDNEVLAYGIGFSLSPVIATIISHFLFRTFGKKNRKANNKRKINKKN